MESEKNNILTLLPTLILSIFIANNMGIIFAILLLILGVLTTEKPLSYNNTLFYILGVAGIVSLYVIKNIYIKGVILLIILGIIITFESKDKNKDKDKNKQFKCFLTGLLLTSLILVWGEYGKEPNLKYIKLFLRR
jgi:hypothetical protein